MELNSSSNLIVQMRDRCAACSLSENTGTDGMRPYEDVLLLARKYMN